MKKAILIILILLILGGAGFFGYQMIKVREEGRFLDGTTLNGENISGMTAEEAALTMTGPYAKTRVDIVEHGKTTLSLSLEEAGYRPDEAKTLEGTGALLDSCLKSPAYVAKSFIAFLIGGSDYELPLETIADEDAFREAVNLETLDEERHEGADAYMEFDKEAGKMVIHPEISCTQIGEEDLQKAVESAIAGAIENKTLGDVITAEIPEDLYAWFLLLEQPHGLRKEINSLAYHQADRDVILIFGAEVLPLFNSPLHFLPHTGQISHELCPGRSKGCTFPVTVKKGKADLFFQKFYLIGKRRLAYKHILCGPAEVQRMSQLNTVINLFCRHVKHPPEPKLFIF